MTSGCLLLTYEVEWDHVGAFLKGNTVHIAKDIFFDFFSNKVQKNPKKQKTTGFTTTTIITDMQESVFQHKEH